jgi:membrane-associated phospholipid phosphatase
MRIHLPLLLAASLVPAIGAAQSTTAAGDPQSSPATQAPATQDPASQKPPAAVGEEGTKPTRSFLSALVHNLGDDLKHMPRWNSAYFLAGGGAGALLVHPADDNINAHLVGSGNDPWFKPGKIVGATPTVLGTAAAAYLIGRTTDRPRLEHLGLDEIEATLLAEGIVEGAKVAIRRDRPLRADGTRQSGFSFPSGHSTLTFAAATVLQQHLGYKAGVPTYLIASYVAASRLHDNRHFASDVVFGAATGIVIGRSVTWHGRNFYAGPMLLPDGGVGIQFTRRAD